jgi:hypothetical protein
MSCEETVMDLSPLAILERAELAARERRLAAAAEAERILAAAAERAGLIEAELPDRIAAAVAELRRAQDERATVELDRIERELADLEAESGRPTTKGAFRAAVDLVVAAVLGERDRPSPTDPPMLETVAARSDGEN